MLAGYHRETLNLFLCPDSREIRADVSCAGDDSSLACTLGYQKIHTDLGSWSAKARPRELVVASLSGRH